MRQFEFVYSDHYEVHLGDDHRFPITKYRKLRESLLEFHILKNEELIPAFPVSRHDLYLAHCKDYVDGVLDLSLEHKRARQIGLPLTEEMVLRTCVSVQASLMAAERALKTGLSGALSSGTHHARYRQGEGFCFFSDFAVIAKKYPKLKILIIDLDVHQGNGNAEILNEHQNVIILDFYCQENYPYRKIQASIDVPIPKHTHDEIYLERLKNELEKLSYVQFDLILYQAGVDGLKDDKLGLLNLSLNGLRKRDELVFSFAFQKQTPISFVIGGGYADPIDLTVEANRQTFELALKTITDLEKT